MLSFITRLLFVAAGTSPNAEAVALLPQKSSEGRTDRTHLVLFGTAAGALTGVRFAPRGRVVVFPREAVQGADKLRVEIVGLPANTCFTIFLSELNGFPFGSLQYVAKACTNQAGRGVVEATVVAPWTSLSSVQRRISHLFTVRRNKPIINLFVRPIFCISDFHRFRNYRTRLWTMLFAEGLS